MKPFEKLLLENRAWAEEKRLKEPDYFQWLATDQQPEFLWIGCSDSRVPAEIIVEADPGSIFVHRNIANQIIATDFNSLSVIEYAIDVLKVRHVIVCGHYRCGGVAAALDKQHPDFTIVNKWLMHVKDVYRLHKEEIDSLVTRDEKLDRLVELNTIEQVRRLAHTSIVQDAWRREQRPTLHGWVFSLNDGMLKQLITLAPGADLDPIFQLAETGTGGL